MKKVHILTEKEKIMT